MENNRSVLHAACVCAMIELYGDTSGFDGLPEPTFSVVFERKMRRLMAHVRGNRYHCLTHSAKIILVAAILAALAAAMVIAGRQFGFALRAVDGGRSSILDVDPREGAYTAPIVCDYIPKGLILEEEKVFKSGRMNIYTHGDVFIRVAKYASYGTIGIDTEFREPREITCNGITYTIAGEEEYPVVLWMDPETKYVYTLDCSNIEEEELLKVAYKTH